MVRVVAEFGQSHRGELDRAMRQAEVAADCGCWGVKWQILDPPQLASHNARRYWSEHLGGSESQFETFAANGMLSPREWMRLADHCRHLDVEFICTPFDLDAVDLLEEIGVNVYKIASGDITYEGLVRRVGETGKPVLLSTGASTSVEVTRALGWLMDESWGVDATLLACTLSYPTDVSNAHLQRIVTLKQELPPCEVGYSDHTLRTDTAMAAAVLGATVLEKHCTLHENGPVPDDRMALSPPRLRQYVAYANVGGLMRGRGKLEPVEAEMAARAGARRGGYATRDLVVGETVGEEDVAWLRPHSPDGFTPAETTKVVGRTVMEGLAAGALIRRDALK